MTIKDLQKLINDRQQRETPQSAELFATLRNKPFWIWDINEHRRANIESHGACCFNHIIGLPQKNGVSKPLFDYEKLLYDTLFMNNDKHDFTAKHVWIKKATGLGVTEFFSRLIVWLCLRDDKLSGSQMCIITGPNLNLATGLVRRLKALFIDHNITFDTKETLLELNGVRVSAYPANHIDAMRSLDNVSFILLDEADFFSPGEQQSARHVSERYIAKSDPFLVMISTPNAPGHLFESIEREPEDACIYKRIKLDWTYGLGKIFTSEEIEKARQSPSFEREYNLAYLGKIGNVFHNKDIERATKIQYDLEPNPMASISMGRISMGMIQDLVLPHLVFVYVNYQMPS